MWFDADLVQSVTEVVPTWLGVVVLVVSFLGSIYVIAPGTVLGYGYWDRRQTATWPGIVIGAYGLFVGLKPMIAIERPGVDPPVPTEGLPPVVQFVVDLAVGFPTDSFPSGHAVAVTVFWGLVVIDGSIGTLRQRLVAAGVIITGVAASRVILGVHYVGDVVVGVLIGAGYLGGMLLVRRHAAWPALSTLLVGAGISTLGLLMGRPVDSLLLLGAAAVAAIGLYVTGYREWETTGEPPSCEVAE